MKCIKKDEFLRIKYLKIPTTMVPEKHKLKRRNSKIFVFVACTGLYGSNI